MQIYKFTLDKSHTDTYNNKQIKISPIKDCEGNKANRNAFRKLSVDARQYGIFAHNSFRSCPIEIIGRDG